MSCFESEGRAANSVHLALQAEQQSVLAAQHPVDEGLAGERRAAKDAMTLFVVAGCDDGVVGQRITLIQDGEPRLTVGAEHLDLLPIIEVPHHETDVPAFGGGHHVIVVRSGTLGPREEDGLHVIVGERVAHNVEIHSVFVPLVVQNTERRTAGFSSRTRSALAVAFGVPCCG